MLISLSALFLIFFFSRFYLLSGSHFSPFTEAFSRIYGRKANHCYWLPRSWSILAFPLPFQKGLMLTVEIQ